MSGPHATAPGVVADEGHHPRISLPTVEPTGLLVQAEVAVNRRPGEQQQHDAATQFSSRGFL